MWLANSVCEVFFLFSVSPENCLNSSVDFLFDFVPEELEATVGWRPQSGKGKAGSKADDPTKAPLCSRVHGVSVCMRACVRACVYVL